MVFIAANPCAAPTETEMTRKDFPQASLKRVHEQQKWQGSDAGSLLIAEQVEDTISTESSDCVLRHCGTYRVLDGLFVSDSIAANSCEFLVANKVTHVVNCSSLEVPNYYVKLGIVYLQIDAPLLQRLDTTFNQGETVDNSLSKAVCRSDSDDVVKTGGMLIRFICHFIQDALQAGGSCLVHSNACGVRAWVFVAIYLMQKYLWTVNKCLQFITSHGPDLLISEAQQAELSTLENDMRSHNTVSSSWSRKSSPCLDDEEQLLNNTYINSLSSSCSEAANLCGSIRASLPCLLIDGEDDEEGAITPQSKRNYKHHCFSGKVERRTDRSRSYDTALSVRWKDEKEAVLCKELFEAYGIVLGETDFPHQAYPSDGRILATNGDLTDTAKDSGFIVSRHKGKDQDKRLQCAEPKLQGHPSTDLQSMLCKKLSTNGRHLSHNEHNRSTTTEQKPVGQTGADAMLETVGDKRKVYAEAADVINTQLVNKPNWLISTKQNWIGPMKQQLGSKPTTAIEGDAIKQLTISKGFENPCSLLVKVSIGDEETIVYGDTKFMTPHPFKPIKNTSCRFMPGKCPTDNTFDVTKPVSYVGGHRKAKNSVKGRSGNSPSTQEANDAKRRCADERKLQQSLNEAFEKGMQPNRSWTTHNQTNMKGKAILTETRTPVVVHANHRVFHQKLLSNTQSPSAVSHFVRNNGKIRVHRS